MSSIYHTEHYSLLTDPGSGVTIMNNTTRRSVYFQPGEDATGIYEELEAILSVPNVYAVHSLFEAMCSAYEDIMTADGGDQEQAAAPSHTKSTLSNRRQPTA